MVKQDKRNILLSFFRDKERQKISFTYAEVALATGYKVDSISKFVSENLKGKYIFQNKRSNWYCQRLLAISDDDFLGLSRKLHKLKY